jgi:hypothetical protein
MLLCTPHPPLRGTLSLQERDSHEATVPPYAMYRPMNSSTASYQATAFFGFSIQ